MKISCRHLLRGSLCLGLLAPAGGLAAEPAFLRNEWTGADGAFVTNAVMGPVSPDTVLLKMETAVAPARLADWKARHPAPFWLFGEEWRFPVRLDVVPAHWFAREPAAAFACDVSRNQGCAGGGELRSRVGARARARRGRRVQNPPLTREGGARPFFAPPRDIFNGVWYARLRSRSR